MNYNLLPKKVLTIAGSDSGGGAGIQADLKTILSHECYGTSAITAITAQNSLGVQAVEGISPSIVSAQIRSCISDIGVDAIKTGMLFNEEVVISVVLAFEEHFSITSHPPIVVDPVCVSTSGHSLLSPLALTALRTRLIPWATLLTPNIAEAEALTSSLPGSIKTVNDMKTCAITLGKMGAKFVLMKGGHLPMEGDKSTKVIVDLLWDVEGEKEFVFERPYLLTKNTHGTGCTLSSAIACRLAQGDSMQDSVRKAGDYVAAAISASYPVGEGHGPVNHAYNLLERSIPLPTPSSPQPFTDYLIAYDPISWNAYVNHPFPNGLAKGDLPLAAFIEFITQDYHFLKQYARANALAAYKSENLEEINGSMIIVAAVVKETANHIKYCETHNISQSELLATPESITNIAYNRYVLDIGNKGSLLDLRVVTAPCLIGYGVVGKRLVEAPHGEGQLVDRSDKNIFWSWIEEYGGDWYQGAVKTGIDLLEKTVAESPISKKQLEELCKIFSQGTKLEVAFWDAAMNAVKQT